MTADRSDNAANANSKSAQLSLLEADPHAYFMALALDARGIEWRVQTTHAEAPDISPKHWLCFKIKDLDLVYRKSIFFEPNKGKWGEEGRKINHDAQIIVADKNGTKEHLNKLGINTPKGRKFRRRHIQDALDYYGKLPGLVCVKPNNGNRGRAVTSAINSYSQYENAVRHVAEGFVNIVVEEHVEGNHYRFFYVEPHVVGVRHGIPLSVVGDGKQTISALLELKNKERRERNLVTHPEVNIDDNIVSYLAAQNLTTSSIPSARQRIYLRSSGGYPEGADTYLLSINEVHPDYIDIVTRACASVPGLHFCGVDIVIKDITQSANNSNYWILELNSDPAFIPFYYPWQGEIVDIAGHTIDMMLERFPFKDDG